MGLSHITQYCVLSGWVEKGFFFLLLHRNIIFISIQ